RYSARWLIALRVAEAVDAVVVRCCTAGRGGYPFPGTAEVRGRDVRHKRGSRGMDPTCAEAHEQKQGNVSYGSRQQRRFKHINGRSPDASWRNRPPTKEQLRVLRRIERETGQPFLPTITRGEASDLIGFRFAENAEARRAHRRATRVRQRAKR
ncbi:MAG: hypothetical protein LC808_28545, partial [Actinobacteria bacterium]|nr:hypothetical protein [Actinomycetota bacterium]